MLPHDEEFDWDAFMRDTFEASCAATGAWLRCLFKMRLSVTRGQITRPMVNYAKLFGMTPDQAKAVIEEIDALGIGDAVTESNGNVTLTNRRMHRAFSDRKHNAERQARYRESRSIGESNGNVTKNAKNASSYVLREEIKKEKKEKRKNVASTRIPDPFPLTDEMIDWARVNHPTLNVVGAHADFIEYWTNNTTAKALKVNWLLTWQKGMKFALKWQEQDSKNGTSTGNYRTDRQREAVESRNRREQVRQRVSDRDRGVSGPDVSDRFGLVRTFEPESD